MLMLTFVSSSQESENTINISDQEVYKYWDIDYDLMKKSKYIYKSILDKYNGEIWFKYTYLIDVNGRPRDFKFISAKPKSTEVEKDVVRKQVLHLRFKRKANTDFFGATRVTFNNRWWHGKKR